MKYNIDYRIKAQITGEEPDIQLEVIFKDDFSNDHYTLKSTEGKDSNINNIPFIILKNGEQIDQISLVNKDSKKFLEEFMALTEDDDFSKAFQSELYDNSLKELNNFFDFYEDAVVLKGITLEGEKRKMKRIAGLIKENND